MEATPDLPGLPAPPPVSDALRAFPVAGVLNPPGRKEIPSRFDAPSPSMATPWSRVMMSIFRRARDPRTLAFLPREGVEAKDAYDTLMVFMGSWDLKHEHKRALLGYALWSCFFAVLVEDTGDIIVCDGGIDSDELKEQYLEMQAP